MPRTSSSAKDVNYSVSCITCAASGTDDSYENAVEKPRLNPFSPHLAYWICEQNCQSSNGSRKNPAIKNLGGGAGVPLSRPCVPGNLQECPIDSTRYSYGLPLSVPRRSSKDSGWPRVYRWSSKMCGCSFFGWRTRRACPWTAGGAQLVAIFNWCLTSYRCHPQTLRAPGRSLL